ncbi:alpha/beta hydrolase [Caballeronia sp. HLA56]
MQRQISAADYAERALALGRTAKDAGNGVFREDIPYGAHPMHKLDVLVPAGIESAKHGKPTKLPVVVLIHGGGFTQGSRKWNALMGPLLMSIPAILVSVGYRFMPEVEWPLPLDDCRLAFEWVLRNIDRFGGDARQVFVGGHSAGAALATLVALDPQTASQRVAGVFALSGSFNRLAITGTAGSEPHLPAGPMPVDQNAPLAVPLVEKNRTAFLLAWGETETQIQRVQHSSFALKEKLAQHQWPVEHFVVSGADHFEVHLALADSSSPVSRQFANWMRRASELRKANEDE